MNNDVWKTDWWPWPTWNRFSKIYNVPKFNQKGLENRLGMSDYTEAVTKSSIPNDHVDSLLVNSKKYQKGNSNSFSLNLNTQETQMEWALSTFLWIPHYHDMNICVCVYIFIYIYIYMCMNGINGPVYASQ